MLVMEREAEIEREKKKVVAPDSVLVSFRKAIFPLAYVYRTFRLARRTKLKMGPDCWSSIV